VEHKLEALENRVLRKVIQPASQRRPVTEKIIKAIVRNIVNLLVSGYH